ncbi:MAG: hypothetical protein ACE5FU_13115 [Nitrospinota bacterium]
MKQINKIPVFDWFYEQGDVFLTIRFGLSNLIQVPTPMLGKEMETFVVGEVPTPKLTYNEQGVSAPMRFGNTFSTCFFPWESIVRMGGASAVIQFAVDEADGESVPEKKKGGATPKKTPRKKNHLRVIK